MAMVVKNNTSANDTLNKVDKNSKAMAKSLKKVSSGMRINGAEDDASGYAISEKMRVQIRALEQADANSQTGSSALKTAEGAVGSTVDILRTLKEKVINAANDSNTDEDRKIIQKELDEMIDQIDDNANVTYNGKYLVDGTHNNQVTGRDGKGTPTYMANEMLRDDMKWGDKLTDLIDTSDRTLGIHSDDTLTVSYVKEGKTCIDVFSPVGDMTMAQIFDDSMRVPDVCIPTRTDGHGHSFDIVAAEAPVSSRVGYDRTGDEVHTASGKNAFTIRAKTEGVKEQLAGLTLSITRKDGSINKSANTVLDSFQETVRAQDPCPDNAFVFQVGTKANQAVKVGLTDMRSQALGLKAINGPTLNIETQKNANAAINVLDNAIQKALDQQTTIGSILSRLEYTSANLVTSDENTQASESTIRDADMAKEMTEYTKNNVLLQASQSMLAQANQNSSAVLSLLQ